MQRIQAFLCGPLSLLMLTAALSTACGGKQVIEGRPPFVGISTMSQSGGQLATEFRIDNQNGVPMAIRAIEIAVTAGDIRLTRENRELELTIDANSAEDFRVQERPGGAALELLDSLERREVNSVAFQLIGRVLTREDGYLRFEQKGHLFPVPGRPGVFRSAVTQAEDLRRHEKL